MGPSVLIHLDAELGVANKPAGILSTEAPGRAGEATVLDRIRAELAARDEPTQLFAVHRLDEETSGTFVVARTREMRQALDAMFRRHTPERVYHAIVLGRPQPRSGKLESRLEVNKEGLVEVVQSGGRTAITHYATVATLGRCAVLACKLDTGRRNQIRVQLADIGNPLVGDRKYGRRHADFRNIKAKRSLLHATAIAFRHPSTRKKLTCVAPFPPDFVEILGNDLAAQLEPTT